MGRHGNGDASKRRRIGSLEVSLVGLGCNNFGGRLDAAATAEVVYAALDAGINLLDTGDFYGMGRNELLMAHLDSERSALHHYDIDSG